jgi:hypothetical protein
MIATLSCLSLLVITSASPRIAKIAPFYKDSNEQYPIADLLILDATTCTKRFFEDEKNANLLARAGVNFASEKKSQRVWPLSKRATELLLESLPLENGDVTLKSGYRNAVPLWTSDSYRLKIFSRFKIDIIEAFPKDVQTQVGNINQVPEFSRLPAVRKEIVSTVRGDLQTLITQFAQHKKNKHARSIFIYPEELFSTEITRAFFLHPDVSIAESLTDITISLPPSTENASYTNRIESLKACISSLKMLSMLRIVANSRDDLEKMNEHISLLANSSKDLTIQTYILETKK